MSSSASPPRSSLKVKSGGQDLHAVVAVLRDREVEIAAHLAQLHLGQLLGEVVDLRLGRVGGMAGDRALGEAVIDAPAALDRRRPRDPAHGSGGATIASPGCSVRQRGAKAFTYWMRSSSSAAGTSHDSIAVPCRPWRSVRTKSASRGSWPAGDRRELVDAQAQIARRRAQAGGGRSLAVARVAVAGPAEVRVDVAPVLERAGRDVAAAERDRRREGRGSARARAGTPARRGRARRRPATDRRRARSCHAHRDVDDQPDDGDEVHVDRREAQPARARLGGRAPRAAARRSRPARPARAARETPTARRTRRRSAPVPGPELAGDQAPPQRRLHEQEQRAQASAPAAQRRAARRARAAARSRPRSAAGRCIGGGAARKRRRARAAARPAPARARPRTRTAAPRTASRTRPGTPSCRRRRSRHAWRADGLAVHDSTSSCASQSFPRATRVGVAELVRPAHDRRDDVEVVVRRRRRHRPLERADLPRVRWAPACRGAGSRRSSTTKISCAAPSTYAGARDPAGSAAAGACRKSYGDGS